MLVPALLVERVVEVDAVDAQDVEAGDAGAGGAFDDALGGQPQRGGELCGCVVEIDGDQHDRRIGILAGDKLDLVGAERFGIETAAQRGEPGIAFEASGAGRQLDLGEVAQVVGELGRGLVAAVGFDLEAAQDDFLEGRRNIRAERAQRPRIAPEPAAQAAHQLRIAEGTTSGGKEIHQHAQREEIFDMMHRV